MKELDDEERAWRKHATMIFDDRIKLIADIPKGGLLLILGLGFFRFVLDPSGSLGVVQGVLVPAGAAALFGVIWIVLGIQKPVE